MRLIILFIGALAANPVYAETLKKVPAKFVHDRIVVTANASDGKPITFYTDTGGGWNAISQSAAARLRVLQIGVDENEDGTKSPLVNFPSVLERSGIPKPRMDRWYKSGLVLAADKALDMDGFLGSRWFAGRVWEFNYPEKTLRVGQSFQARKNEAPIELGFRANNKGVRDLDFPRIAITIDGETMPMLLDTGATARLTPASSSEFGLPEGTKIATSFIIQSTLEKWIARHPDWKVIEKAEGRTFRMIQVPEVHIGTLTVGPVWFTERRDSDFREYMSMMMDQPIDGAIGGSALKYCRFVIDYPNAVAYFQSPTR